MYVSDRQIYRVLLQSYNFFHPKVLPKYGIKINKSITSTSQSTQLNNLFPVNFIIKI